MLAIRRLWVKAADIELSDLRADDRVQYMSADPPRSDARSADGSPHEWEATVVGGPYSAAKVMVFLGLVGGILAVANFLAGSILPQVPDSSTADRNEFRFRGYPEFLSGIEHSSAPRDLVLLSNSQAYSGEYRASEGYPARLEGLMNAAAGTGAGAQWRVHNWSVDGTTSMEYMLMAAYLAGHPPDLLVASIGYADFRGQNVEESFSHCRSDTPRLVSRPAIARRLPAQFWLRHGAVEDTLSAVVRDRFPVAQVPEFAWSWIDQQYPGTMPLFYAPSLYHHPWKLDVERKGTRPNFIRPPNEAEGATNYAYDERSTALLEEFLVALKQVGASHVLVVACPGNERPGSAHAPFVEAFRSDLRVLTEAMGVPFRDLSDALPGADFLDSLHFTKPNHRRYAERLWRELNPDL